jgi:hypothetical protein
VDRLDRAVVAAAQCDALDDGGVVPLAELGHQA